jgi:hypothetical protein
LDQVFRQATQSVTRLFVSIVRSEITASLPPLQTLRSHR